MKKVVCILEGVKRTCDPAGKTSGTEISVDRRNPIRREVWIPPQCVLRARRLPSMCDYGRIAAKNFLKIVDSQQSQSCNNLSHRLSADFRHRFGANDGFR
jgi:hypothetical protein